MVRASGNEVFALRDKTGTRQCLVAVTGTALAWVVLLGFARTAAPPPSWPMRPWRSRSSTAVLPANPPSKRAMRVLLHVLSTGSLDGVQFTPMPTILGEYSDGSAACLRLSDASRARMDWGVFGAFVNECVGTVKYDTAGLFEYLLRDIPVLGAHVAPEEKTNEMYCCAFVIASLTKGGLLNGVRPTPR